MAPIVVTSVSRLVNENSPEEFLQASELLQKFANNIINYPNEPKYRRIRLSNPTIETKLLPVSGAMECLFEMGFTEDGEHLSLPASSSLAALREIRNQLEKERTVVQSSQGRASAGRVDPVPQAESAPIGQGPSAVSATCASTSSSQQPPVIQTNTANNLQQIQVKEQAFYRKMEGQMTHVLVYEDVRLQQKARETIPVVQITEEARHKLELLNQSSGDPHPPVTQSSSTSGHQSNAKLNLQDCIVIALLNWFKTSFFKWVDAPACRSCGGKTTQQGMVEPTQGELQWGGNRVENYRCSVCGQFRRFVRYNHPGKLLETREGRCGEWANCFTLCCRALQLEARYVLDWTDHVWTEVFSTSQQRWIHCDPCENTCDKPLLYEKGWGKKLTYVIAFSKDEIQDVSWRYTAKHAELLSRRTECRESWLANTIYNLNSRKWQGFTETRRNTWLHRLVKELVEFITPDTSDEQSLGGRTTGSLAWRLARGETGSRQNELVLPDGPYVFKASEEEKANKCLHVTYNCARDEYVRLSDNLARVPGFQSMVHRVQNIFRKEEHDWEMVYLARTEGAATAEIAWKFDFKDSGVRVDRVEVRVDSRTYENGNISWTICGEDTCTMLTGGPMLQTVTDLQGETGFTVAASLSGGRGDVAWQHTQLFRQSLTNHETNPLEIKVYFQ